MAMNNFYKYIARNGKGYSIVKDNENYGTYSKVTDALYERDRLIKADWDWEGAVHIEETDNVYESIDLPPFRNEYTYIYEVSQTHTVFKDNEYQCSFNTKRDAYNYAKHIGGVVRTMNKRYRIAKKINGKSVYFGQYPTIEEAKEKRDELIKNGWNQ